MTDFGQIFPPAFINAGYMSMAENDIMGRVTRICEEIENNWGRILPSSMIITNALAADHLDYWILPPAARDMLDKFDIVEG